MAALHKKAAAKKKAVAKKKSVAKKKPLAKMDMSEDMAAAEKKKAATSTPKDMFADMALRAKHLTAENATEAARDLVLADSTNSFELGAVLLEVRNRALFPEGMDFKAWVADELEYKYRKAAYLIEIYSKAQELGLQWEDVKHLGWSKLAKLSSILTAENHKKVLEEVADMKLIEVEAYVKDMKAGEASPTKPTGLTKWSAQLSDDQHELVEGAMEHAMEAGNVDTHGMALEYVSQHYLSSTGTAMPEAQAEEAQQDSEATEGEVGALAAPGPEELVELLKGLTIEVVAEIVMKAHPGYGVFVDDEADAPASSEL